MPTECEVTLPTHLDIASVTEFKPVLLEALNSEGGIVVQAASVARADAIGLQLLLAFKLETQRRGVAMRWQEPSDVLVEAAQLIDLEQHLALTADVSGAE